MGKTIKVAVARQPSIELVEDIASIERRIRVTSSSGTFAKPTAPAEFYIALTDGYNVIYKLPVSEDTATDFLDELLEHYGLPRKGPGINGING